MLTRAAAIVSLVSMSGSGLADILRVPDEFPTIQSAIDASRDADEIEIAAGDYREMLSINSKALTLRGAGETSTFLMGPDGNPGDPFVIVTKSQIHLTDLNLGGRRTRHESERVQFFVSAILIERVEVLTHMEFRECSIELTDSRIRDIDRLHGSDIGTPLYVTSSSLTVRGCEFANNESTLCEPGCDCSNCTRHGEGGAIYAEDSSVVVANTMFRNNEAAFGGALFLRNSTTLVSSSAFLSNEGSELHRFSDSVLTNLRARVGNGGAIYCDGGSTLVSNCEFTSNTSAVWGGAIAAVLESQGASLAISGCLFTRNTVEAFESHESQGCCDVRIFDGEGGALWVRALNGGVASVARCEFSENRAAVHAGAIFAEGEVVVRQCIIQDNRSYSARRNCPGGYDCVVRSELGRSGGISMVGGRIENVLILENVGQRSVGGASLIDTVAVNLLIAGNQSERIGGLVLGGSTEITNSTIVGNVSTNGDTVIEAGKQLIANSVIWGNSPIPVSATNIIFSTVEGGHGGAGNIDADPEFVDPDGPDDDPFTFADNDYRLSSGSPAVDAARNEFLPEDANDADGDGDRTEPFPFDLSRLRRIVDGGSQSVDMGAYEWQQGACPADLDEDGDLDSDDLGIFLDAFASRDLSICDLNADGVCDADDFFDYLDQFAAGC